MAVPPSEFVGSAIGGVIGTVSVPGWSMGSLALGPSSAPNSVTSARGRVASGCVPVSNMSVSSTSSFAPSVSREWSSVDCASIEDTPSRMAPVGSGTGAVSGSATWVGVLIGGTDTLLSAS